MFDLCVICAFNSSENAKETIDTARPHAQPENMPIGTLQFRPHTQCVSVGDNWQDNAHRRNTENTGNQHIGTYGCARWNHSLDNAHGQSTESTINQYVEISRCARWKNLVANEHR